MSKNLATEEEDSREALLDRISKRLEKVGDLPIFSSTVNRVQLIGSDPDSDAMQLAMEILKDANLSTKVLKIANSSYYSRGAVKIGSLSRAVVLLGFDAVKSTVLTMKLLDSFQFEHPNIDLGGKLVSSYMSAGFVKELAGESGVKDIEQSYICGLLHNLGEIIVAYTIPDEYLEIADMVKSKELEFAQAQRKVLGMPYREIGQAMVEKWEFPAAVSKTIAPYSKPSVKGPIRDKIELNRAVASLTHQMMELLYAEHPSTRMDFNGIRKELSEVVGVTVDVIGNCLDKSFKQSCDLAAEYGIDKKKLVPRVRFTGEDEAREKIARQLAFMISDDTRSMDEEDSVQLSDDGYEQAPVEVDVVDEEFNEDAQTDAPVADSDMLLATVHEITALITKKAHVNSVFKKVLEGMHRGVGFDRATLCLLSPDHKTYSARLAVGRDAERLKNFFSMMPVDKAKDMFSSLILEGNEIFVHDVSKGSWQNHLPARFMEKLNTTSFLVAAIRVNTRPVGMFYADKHKQNSLITTDQKRGFMQLVAQAQLALQIR